MKILDTVWLENECGNTHKVELGEDNGKTRILFHGINQEAVFNSSKLATKEFDRIAKTDWSLVTHADACKVFTEIVNGKDFVSAYLLMAVDNLISR